MRFVKNIVSGIGVALVLNFIVNDALWVSGISAKDDACRRYLGSIDEVLVVEEISHKFPILRENSFFEKYLKEQLDISRELREEYITKLERNNKNLERAFILGYFRD